jgi:hypothetical protein
MINVEAPAPNAGTHDTGRRSASPACNKLLPVERTEMKPQQHVVPDAKKTACSNLRGQWHAGCRSKSVKQSLLYQVA